jgi:hypothetical protein
MSVMPSKLGKLMTTEGQNILCSKIRSKRGLSGKSGVECGAVHKGMANRSPFVLVFIAQRTHQCELPGKEDVTA